MNRFVLVCIVLSFWNCSAQKDTIQIKEVFPVEIEEDILFALLYINDYNLEDETAELKIVVNEKGLYQYKDSTLVNANTKIWLHKFPKINKNKITDCGELPIPYGYLEGKIINGKKEGKWFKKIKIPKQPHYVIVKMLHYKNGVLDGKYQVYDTNGKVLYPLEPHPLYPDEYENYETFKTGSGWYYDYYYETRILKETGFYKKSKKNGSWILYDKNGNEIKREYYSNGMLIN